MTEFDPTAAEAGDEQHNEIFNLLDRYVHSLHAGDAASRSVILQRNPDLADLLGCLNALETLAPTERDSSTAQSPLRDLVAGSEEPGDDKGEIEFGKYALIEEIGRGGMGVVYLARQTDLDRTVALKMILSSRLASDEEIRRFYAEAKAAGRVRHQHIVGIHEVGQIRGQHYFAMDYIAGRSLADSLREQPPARDTAVQWVIDIARAVHHLHEHNIIHRDLKPSNILIDGEGKPFVTDFGLAKIFDQGDSGETRSGTIIGTPSYMSPEQAGGHVARVSPQSDVYSLGAILYELLTGRPPFLRNTPHETLIEVIEGEPTWPGKLSRGIPPELELICMRCLEKDPAARYASAASLADDLEHYLRREPIQAKPSNPLQRMRRWGRRQPALVSRLGGLFATAAILQFMYPIFGSDLQYHLKVMSILGIWAAVSVIFQLMLRVERNDYLVRFGWSGSDVTLLTILLYTADGPVGPLLIGYPLLVAASGLFFRVRLVLFTTFVSLVAYGSLVVLRGEDPPVPAQYPVLYSAVLAVLGFIVAHQVYRVRALSRFYEHRRLP